MSKNNTYRLVQNGKKAVRRDYSKVSGTLELPNLVDIQTSSFEWFRTVGLREVFEEIYPIKNYNGNITLEFLDYKFGEPEYDANECKIRELTYSAPIRATMRLRIEDETSTGEVITKEEEVFLGDFPILTPTGTFIINGAERVIVSQIVRSPGAYFSMDVEDKTRRDIYNSELIPSRGTWLEFMTDAKKSNIGRIINVSIDRKRKIVSSILLKAIGMSLDIKSGEDALLTDDFKKFLSALQLPVYDIETVTDEREFLNIYLLLYTAIFGNYEEVINTLISDRLKFTKDSLLAIYENQRSDEIPTVDGAFNLMNAKFFDARRYDLNKAGRYKVTKKLGAYGRTKGHYLAEDLLDENGKLVLAKGTHIDSKELLAVVRDTLAKGLYMHALPQRFAFSHPDVVSVPVSYNKGLVGRILADNVEGDTLYLEKGTVLTATDVEGLKKNGVENVDIYGGIFAEAVELNEKNVMSVLDYGRRLYSLGRLVDAKGLDVEKDDDLLFRRYIPDAEEGAPELTGENLEWLIDEVKNGAKYTLYLVGSANQIIYVNTAPDDEEPVKVIGIDPLTLKKTIIISDMYAQYSYMLNMMDGVGVVDDIDQLGNRRIRTVGELIQNQYRIGLSRMEKNVKEKMSITEVSNLSPKNLTNIRSLTMAIKEFFSSSQLSQFMDQQNPLAELTNKRRISALGPGGLTRERAGFEVRDVHSTHYGRICPIETPEGPNIGLINYLTSYGKINEYGFIQTPYRIVEKETGKVLEDVVYLSADDEMDYVIAQANEVHDGYLGNEQCVCRYQTETVIMPRERVELVDVSPKQIISIAAACIPFLENDDATRALMGANMQRQAVPLLRPHSPNVGTGMEYRVAKDSGSAVVSTDKGMVSYVDSSKVVIDDGEKEHVYELAKFRRSNAGTCVNQTPIVEKGEMIERGDILADGPSMENGELALGQNVKIAFMTWHGYNYEDAVIMSERLVRDDVFTSIHIEEYSIECRETKLGPEEITRDIPNVSEVSCRNLDSRGIVMVGAEVKEGDILVGKVTPKGQSEVTPEEKLLLAIFGEKSREVRDNSLKVPHGGAGIVQSIRIFTRKDGHELAPGVNEVIKVYIVQKRKISEGDKMAGRHGNKGVIAKILPQEDMPFLPDGTQIDILLNPFGVPSRMNIGQVFEVHLGLAAERLGCKFATPVFDGISNEELMDIFKQTNASPDGKTILYDGQTGEPFDERVAVGVMYMIKLAHMVDDKLHARATGPYSLVTQQPLGGKAQNGGQRFGEMEVWALEAYGAAYTLSEILTVKSDDITGRTKTYESIIKGKPIPEPSVGESFRVLTHELQALALDVKVFDKEGNKIELSQYEEETKPAAFPNEMVADNATEELHLVDDEDIPEAAVVGVDDFYDMEEY